MFTGQTRSVVDRKSHNVVRIAVNASQYLEKMILQFRIIVKMAVSSASCDESKCPVQ